MHINIVGNSSFQIGISGKFLEIFTKFEHILPPTPKKWLGKPDVIEAS